MPPPNTFLAPSKYGILSTITVYLVLGFTIFRLLLLWFFLTGIVAVFHDLFYDVTGAFRIYGPDHQPLIIFGFALIVGSVLYAYATLINVHILIHRNTFFRLFDLHVGARAIVLGFYGICLAWFVVILPSSDALPSERLDKLFWILPYAFPVLDFIVMHHLMLFFERNNPKNIHIDFAQESEETLPPSGPVV